MGMLSAQSALVFHTMGLADPPAFLYGGDGSRSVRAADNSPLLYPMRCLSVPWILSLDRREAKPKQARGPGQGIQCYTLDILLLTRCTERDLSGLELIDRYEGMTENPQKSSHSQA